MFLPFVHMLLFHFFLYNWKNWKQKPLESLLFVQIQLTFREDSRSHWLFMSTTFKSFAVSDIVYGFVLHTAFRNLKGMIPEFVVSGCRRHCAVVVSRELPSVPGPSGQ